MGWEQRKPTPEELKQGEREDEERKAKASAEAAMKGQAEKAGLSDEEQKMAQEARGDAQRVLDEKAVEEQMKAIEALGESPLDKLAEDAKKNNDEEKAA